MIINCCSLIGWKVLYHVVQCSFSVDADWPILETSKYTPLKWLGDVA